MSDPDRTSVSLLLLVAFFAAFVKVASCSGSRADSPAAPVAEPCVPGQEHTENDIVFVRICPGTFTMGSAKDDKQAYNRERPAHQVTLSEFWIGKTEITNEQYHRFHADHQGEAYLPVADVSWDDAKAACEYFGGHLPTEAEWEYAARAGSQTAWSFGDDEKTLGDYAWYGKNSGNMRQTVATKKPNAWNLYDMHGNVMEWVTDWNGTYTEAPQIDPRGPATGMYRILRGGGFDMENPARNLRSAARFMAVPTLRGTDIGFRCARDPRHDP